MSKIGHALEILSIMNTLRKGVMNLSNGNVGTGLAQLHAAALGGGTFAAKTFPEKLGTEAATAATPVLKYAGWAMFPLPFMVGDGAEEGRRLELGAEEFHDAHSALELAIADPSYRGASHKSEREVGAGASRVVSAWGACATSPWPIG